MKLKGDLDSIGLAELFKTVADQKVNGILSVTSAMGEKHISIQQGALSVISDRLAERTRLGDLLITRGHLTDSQLAETLKHQRQNDPHTKLGDLLVKKGILGDDKIQEAMRFQLEEEIYDLFTWKGAIFEFDSDKGVDDVPNQGATKDDLHQLSIDPQALIADASKRMVEWKEIQQRLPTPYLCFKISPKGDELFPRATRSTQVVLKLLKEGRTLETTVKRSCMGRFATCKAVIKLLDDGWIFPYPTGELRMLASEHRAQKRYADALNIYRRLLDANEGETERAQIQQMVDDTIDAILRAREAGDDFEGNEIVSHKKAAEDYIRRQRNRRIALVGFAVVSAGVIVFLLLNQYAPQTAMPQDYLNAITASDTALSEHKYEEAIEVWEKFYESMRDKTSDTAERVNERRKSLPKKYDTYIEGLLQPIEVAENVPGKTDFAETGYSELLKQYPKSPLSGRMKQGLDRIRAKKEKEAREQALAKINRTLLVAKDEKTQKKYTPAREKFEEVLKNPAAEPAMHKDAETGLAEIAAIEAKSKDTLDQAQAELGQKHAEKAITLFKEACKEWPDLPSSQTAQSEANRLSQRLTDLDVLITFADRAEKSGDPLTAREKLLLAVSDYAEFEKVEPLKDKIKILSDRVDSADSLLKEARAFVDAKKYDEARKKFADLIKYHSAFLEAKKVEIPVLFSSSRPATVKVDGVVVGKTDEPINVMLPCAKGMTITFERENFQVFEKKIVNRLREDELVIIALMRPIPLKTLNFAEPIFASPRVIDDTLYILHGTNLSAISPDGEKELWKKPKLLDENVGTRPNSDGNGVVMVPDPTWWYTRSTVEPYPPDSIVLALRSREIVEIKNKGAPVVLAKLPVEPVGQPFLERNSALAGKSLVAVACADGKVRCYDIAKPEAVLWEKVIDPTVPPALKDKIVGLSPRPNACFLVLSANGRLVCFSVLKGEELWSVELKLAGERNALPATSDINIAAVVGNTGNVNALDLNQHERLWELANPQDAADSVGADNTGVYVATQGGSMRKYSIERAARTPKLIWERALDGPPDSAVVIGAKAIYVATGFSVYAINSKDGNVLWNYRTQFKTLSLGVFKDFVYVGSQNGKAGSLIILNGE